jgi:hypothetical protein
MLPRQARMLLSLGQDAQGICACPEPGPSLQHSLRRAGARALLDVLQRRRADPAAAAALARAQAAAAAAAIGPADGAAADGGGAAGGVLPDLSALGPPVRPGGGRFVLVGWCLRLAGPACYDTLSKSAVCLKAVKSLSQRRGSLLIRAKRRASLNSCDAVLVM